MVPRRHIVVINPNTNPATTTETVALTRQACGENAEVEGMTAPFGSRFLSDQRELDTAAIAVAEMVTQLAVDGRRRTGIMIAAFGDPGLDDARRLFTGPVVGIGEAGLLAGAADGRPFSIVTTTVGLGTLIEQMADDLGFAGQLRSVRRTPSHPSRLIGEPDLLFAELSLAAEQAVSLDGAQAIVIGGGPLAKFAKGIEHGLGVPVIDPIAAAVGSLMHQFELRGWQGGQMP